MFRGGLQHAVLRWGRRMTGSACKRWTLCGRSGGIKDQGRGSGGGKGLGVPAYSEAGGFFLRVFFALFCDFFQLSFLNRLGYPRGRFWEGKIFPKSTQEEPSWVQDGLFTPDLVENSDFHGSLRFPMFFDDFCFQDGCENDPRST